VFASLSGDTRLHLILGDPVAQTRSPEGLTREFAARGVNAVCVPVHVAAADFDQFVPAAKRVQNIDGFIITIPHKFAALAHCEEASDRAKFLGAANLLHRIAPGRWRGDMTDGVATVAALRRAGCEPGGRRALVIGAGGAGSAVALALIDAEVAKLFVMDIDSERRNGLVHRLSVRAPAVAVGGAIIPSDYDLVVNATPLGMKVTDPLPIDAAQLNPSAFVVDLVTKPVMTRLLDAARHRGCRVVTGEDMFAVQASTMADILLASPAS
jgi:shikimate dehydrogenase